MTAMQIDTLDLDLATSTDTAALGQAAMKRVNARHFDTARPLIERALALDPHNGMLAHVKAHLTSDSGALEEGAGYLRAFLAEHDPFQGINVHSAWHLAMIELERARPAAALDWYARVVGPKLAEYPMTFFSAVTVLWRLELYGYGALLRTRGEQLPWAQAHTAALRLAGVGEDGSAAVSGLNDTARAIVFLATSDEEHLAGLLGRLGAADPTVHAVGVEVVLPFVAGLRAFWHGDYAAAVDLVEPVAPSFGRISEFQDHRNVYEDTLVEAQLRAGRFATAAENLRRRPAAVQLPRYHYWLGRALSGLGQSAAAAASFRAARRGWPDAEPDAPEIIALESLLAAT